MLPRAGLGNDALFAHELREQSLAHAVVEFMRAGVIQILALEIDLATAELARNGFAVINRRRTTLKLAANATQLADEVRRVADRLIRVRDLFEGGDQFLRQICAAVLAEASVRVRILLEVSGEIHDRCSFDELLKRIE